MNELNLSMLSNPSSTPSLARPLFGERLRRRPLRRRDDRGPPSLTGLVVISLLLLFAILLPSLLHQESETNVKGIISKLIEEDIPLIFTSEAINNCSLPFWADYRDVFNACSFSLLIGVLVSLFTYFSVFYDSHTPGLYPLSPISPKRRFKTEGVVVRTGWSISYKMVLVNGIVFFFLSIFFLRQYLNVPFWNV
ncbi:PREDICTED: ADP-ribosylation factor-like protein 6-interacting protein 6 isoform X2 [Amphimedon queenslandica]|uniref:Uncharacterized protein n=1 Tax=Amphimedon queenslandica TaxID=400682 RepID=A0AAN0IA37_AMPQE|nr:PREDICTED: ADP-ribosylation factor-like protein 6-interacting protein 6 isoform X2 [Amphimedon queenslandica]|eukprot:XP_003383678.1 PREDICTED: ADP-ribosylation factor-like protein 6-interacting protein 6 isoform X2 [Amphimedon queenslandica]